MGTSITGDLTPAQIAQTQANQAAMASAGLSLPPPPRPFVFFAAFDGTNNDKDNLKLSGRSYQIVIPGTSGIHHYHRSYAI